MLLNNVEYIYIYVCVHICYVFDIYVIYSPRGRKGNLDLLEVEVVKLEEGGWGGKKGKEGEVNILGAGVMYFLEGKLKGPPIVGHDRDSLSIPRSFQRSTQDDWLIGSV